MPTSLFIFLGLTKVVDMGTGLNSQIIATSTYWKFEMLRCCSPAGDASTQLPVYSIIWDIGYCHCAADLRFSI